MTDAKLNCLCYISILGTIYLFFLSFFLLMAYQLFLGYLMLGGLGCSYLSQGYLPKSERNSATGVQTRVLRFRSPSL